MINVYSENPLKFSEARCNGCQMCVKVCPHGVFAPNGKVVKLVNKSSCMECGACMLNCESRAFSVQSGVGCATAIFVAALKGNKTTECSCG